MRLPSGRTFELDREDSGLDAAKRAIEAATGLPAACQELLLDGVAVEALPATGTLTLDVVLRVGDYVIASPRVSGGIDGEVFHPAVALEQTRDLERFRAISGRCRFSDDRPLEGQVDLSRQKQRARQRLEPYARHAEARRARLRTLRRDLDAGAVLAMTFNAPYAPLFHNWHESCRANDIDVRSRTVLFPMDEEADALGRSLGYATLFDPESYGTYGCDPDVEFGDAQWMDCLFMKNAVMGDLLEADCDVLFQDVDVVWRRDPLSLLEAKARFERWDFLFQTVGWNPKFQPTQYNSGFVYARNSAWSRHAWERVLENQHYVYVYHSQQAPLNVMMGVFGALGLRTAPLPERQFVNGHLIPGRVPKQPEPLHPEAYVIHFNWTDGLATKLERMHGFKLWYLDSAKGPLP